jgi:hypothetical protein
MAEDGNVNTGILARQNDPKGFPKHHLINRILYCIKHWKTWLKAEGRELKWKTVDGWEYKHYQCPKCNKEIICIAGNPNDNGWQYCPCCGQHLPGTDPREMEDWEKEGRR